MVNRCASRCAGSVRARAFLTVELMVALGLIVLALLPLTMTFAQERRLLVAHYHRAVALQIVDGEYEILRAGAWRQYAPGQHPYAVQAQAATNLPPGEFRLTVRDGQLRLVWQPAGRSAQAAIVREGPLP